VAKSSDTGGKDFGWYNECCGIGTEIEEELVGYQVNNL